MPVPTQLELFNVNRYTVRTLFSDVEMIRRIQTDVLKASGEIQQMEREERRMIEQHEGLF